jgi:glutaredoxin-like protein NrdH
MKIEHVEGKKKGKVMLYALSTCVWCNKTKKYMGELGIDYYFTNVDMLPEKEREEAEKEIMKWNPSCSFPTIVFNDSNCVVGYNPEEITKNLK